MKSHLLCIIVSLLGIYNIEVSEAHCFNDYCPKYYIITTNFSNPVEVAAAQLNLVESLWASKCPLLTNNAEQFKEVILLMARSDNLIWNAVAAIATAWSWSILTQYESKPNYCAFAKMTELTLLDRNSLNYCQKLSRALQDLHEFTLNTEIYVRATTMKNSECGTCIVENLAPKCTARDSLRSAKKLWELKGASYPPAFQTSTLKLYESNNYLEQILGVIGTASLTEHLLYFFAKFDLIRMYQIFQMQLTGKIPRKCCDNMEADLGVPYDNMGMSLTAPKNFVKEQAGCPIN